MKNPHLSKTISSVAIAFSMAISGCSSATDDKSTPAEQQLSKQQQESSKQKKPNILLIVSDDAGYSDFGFSGTKNFATPNLNKLAQSGVTFEQGYVSASVCSPSRAGLLTGRYQQRFGHHNNLPPKPIGNDKEEMAGMAVEEFTIADLLKAQGYQTAAIGKWHLGRMKHFHPQSRGFDEFYGVLGGAREYFASTSDRVDQRVLRGQQAVGFKGYMTDVLGQEAEQFIERNSESPFFLYLSYTAVHTPMQGRADKVEKFSSIEDNGRRELAAMTESLDDSVGGVMAKLETLGLTENTLVIFVNDNGGSSHNHSVNLPLSGFKGGANEGSLRVPYLISWPESLPDNLNYMPMVSSLDILPTVLAAAGAELPSDRQYDGINLLPYLSKSKSINENSKPHDELYWQRGRKTSMREGDLKFILHSSGIIELYDLSTDISESNNLADQRPIDVARLMKKLKIWQSQMIAPTWQTKFTSKLDKNGLPKNPKNKKNKNKKNKTAKSKSDNHH